LLRFQDPSDDLCLQFLRKQVQQQQQRVSVDAVNVFGMFRFSCAQSKRRDAFGRDVAGLDAVHDVFEPLCIAGVEFGIIAEAAESVCGGL